LRFHTGCRYTNDPSQAGFLWLAAGDEWPLLETLNVGCDEYPDQSATCVMELDALHGEDAERWMLQGPGIDGSIQLTTRGLPPNFGEQWARNHSLFPRGVDVFLASPTQIVGLPRTTRLYKKTSVEH
jgi:alpha-D-ribose 1-methylphosphonate 5-triphosphate synthase subunit PhnH